MQTTHGVKTLLKFHNKEGPVFINFIYSMLQIIPYIALLLYNECTLYISSHDHHMPSENEFKLMTVQ